MPKHNVYDPNVVKRRELVAQMKLRYGWSTRKICESLHKQQDAWNPDTGKPWSHATIIRDLQFLIEEWQAEAAKAIHEVQANHLRAIRMAREQAWRNNDIGSVLRALKQEAELYGIDAPKKVQLSREGALNDIADMLGIANGHSAHV